MSHKFNQVAAGRDTDTVASSMEDDVGQPVDMKPTVRRPVFIFRLSPMKLRNSSKIKLSVLKPKYFTGDSGVSGFVTKKTHESGNQPKSLRQNQARVVSDIENSTTCVSRRRASRVISVKEVGKVGLVSEVGRRQKAMVSTIPANTETKTARKMTESSQSTTTVSNKPMLDSCCLDAKHQMVEMYKNKNDRLVIRRKRNIDRISTSNAKSSGEGKRQTKRICTRNVCTDVEPDSEPEERREEKIKEKKIAVKQNGSKCTATTSAATPKAQRTKDPPSKDLVIFRQKRALRAKGLITSSGSESDSSDMTYVLSSDSEASSMECYSDSETENNIDGSGSSGTKKLLETGGLSEWNQPAGKQKIFQCTSDSINGSSDIVPAADSHPVNFFHLLVDDEVIQLMVDETNRNGQQVCSPGQNTPNSRFNYWRDTDKDEIKVFLGILLWMGLVCMSTIECYWRNSELYRNSVAKVMTRNRFQLLLRLLHFSDNNAADGDRLHKIRPLADLLVHKFQAARRPKMIWPLMKLSSLSVEG